MGPRARTLWAGKARSCQLRSKPWSERRKLPARTKLTRSFFPTLRGSSCWVGMVIRELEGRTTRVDMRVRRGALGSARGGPGRGGTGAGAQVVEGGETEVVFVVGGGGSGCPGRSGGVGRGSAVRVL